MFLVFFLHLLPTDEEGGRDKYLEVYDLKLDKGSGSKNVLSVNNFHGLLLLLLLIAILIDELNPRTEVNAKRSVLLELFLVI